MSDTAKNKPSVHTFGIAKYVYASDYDMLERENAKLISERDEARSQKVIGHVNEG